MSPVLQNIPVVREIMENTSKIVAYAYDVNQAGVSVNNIE
jgi:hypothetical protein